MRKNTLCYLSSTAMYSTKSFLTSFDVSYDKISKLIYNSEDIVTNLDLAMITVVSGGFDPLHSGHLDMLEEAYWLRKYCDGVIVLLNSDEWLTRKKGKSFMPFEERKRILEGLKVVDKVIAFDDSDDTCISGLEKVKQLYPSARIAFCNGGDRTKENIPESNVEGITCLFGIGGGKTNSSSELTSEQRVWGSFQDLYQRPGCKVKELIIAPNSGISYQRHKHRAEIWFVREGTVQVKYTQGKPENAYTIGLGKHDTFTVKLGAWHQLYNTSEENCYIIEIQYGEQTVETDIERLEYYSPTTP